MTRSCRVVAVQPAGLRMPPSCACCGQAAAASRALVRSDGASVIVPYCPTCQRHASSGVTAALAVALASGLAGGTLATGLPLVWPHAPAAVYLLLVIASALGPPLLAGAVRRGPALGHTAARGAVWWAADGGLACTSARWARELVDANRGVSTPALLREPGIPRWHWTGLAVVVAVTPFLYALHHPVVRIVNLSGRTLAVWVDGHRVGSLPPTSTESPTAGLVVRLPSGRREVAAETPRGDIVQSSEIVVESGAEHLYAPGSSGQCFWLETTGYGRRRDARRELLPLPADRVFWRLPVTVDTWFAPNPPPPAGGDARSTGGRLTALRHAPCAEAPPPIRRALLGS